MPDHVLRLQILYLMCLIQVAEDFIPLHSNIDPVHAKTHQPHIRHASLAQVPLMPMGNKMIFQGVLPLLGKDSSCATTKGNPGSQPECEFCNPRLLDEARNLCTPKYLEIQIFTFGCSMSSCFMNSVLVLHIPREGPKP